MANRKGFETYFISMIKELITGNKDVLDKNLKLINRLFESMNDKQFELFVSKLESGELVLPIIDPNGANGIDYENNLKLIEKLGIELFQNIIQNDNGSVAISPIKCMILELPGKKPIQFVDKKRSIPKDVNSTNAFTGQVTNSSKSMSLTGPELPLMMANGMHNSIKELVKYRGGDVNAGIALDKLAAMGYDINQSTLEQYSSGPLVNNTFKQFLNGMHIDPEIKKK